MRGPWCVLLVVITWRFINGSSGYRGGICTTAIGDENCSGEIIGVRNNLLSSQKEPLEFIHIIERSRNSHRRGSLSLFSTHRTCRFLTAYGFPKRIGWHNIVCDLDIARIPFGIPAQVILILRRTLSIRVRFDIERINKWIVLQVFPTSRLRRWRGRAVISCYRLIRELSECWIMIRCGSVG